MVIIPYALKKRVRRGHRVCKNNKRSWTEKGWETLH